MTAIEERLVCPSCGDDAHLEEVQPDGTPHPGTGYIEDGPAVWCRRCHSVSDPEDLIPESCYRADERRRHLALDPLDGDDAEGPCW